MQVHQSSAKQILRMILHLGDPRFKNLGGGGRRGKAKNWEGGRPPPMPPRNATAAHTCNSWKTWSVFCNYQSKRETRLYFVNDFPYVLIQEWLLIYWKVNVKTANTAKKIAILHLLQNRRKLIRSGKAIVAMLIKSVKAHLYYRPYN